MPTTAPSKLERRWHFLLHENCCSPSRISPLGASIPMKETITRRCTGAAFSGKGYMLDADHSTDARLLVAHYCDCCGASGCRRTSASMVGFISLCGIASRNSILLMSHYLYLVEHEGEGCTYEMIGRAGHKRGAPMTMSALTEGITLVPFVLAGGKRIKKFLIRSQR